MRHTISRILNWFAMLLLLTVATRPSAACDIPGMETGERPWVTLLIEDHPGMREILWDGAFTDLNTAGPFLKDHRYALVTEKTPYVADYGCWDQSVDCGHRDHDDGCDKDKDHDRECDKDNDKDHDGNCKQDHDEDHHESCQGGTKIGICTWTSDRKGVILKVGTNSTWIPATAIFSGADCPSVTFRGAYLNWLLLNRGKTPSISSESHWQRVQRGALAAVRDLLTRGSGAPQFRIVGIGTSGRLLIPPGEGLSAGENAVAHMEPSCRGGSMEDALERVLRAIREHHINPCVPNVVLVISDGNELASACGSAKTYENHPSYADMLKNASSIHATGRANVWAWDVDGNSAWAREIALRGAGNAFAGDAVTALDAAVKAWVSGQAAPLQIALALDQPSPTRVAPAHLTVQSNHSLLTLSLNGLPLTPTGLVTIVPLPLKEGLNIFTVDAKDSCGGHATVSASITLDTTPPLVTLVSPLDGLHTNAALITVAGQVDDIAATLTVNGQPVVLVANGSFSKVLSPAEGPFTITVSATDLAGNIGSATRNIVIDRAGPKITLKPVPLLTNQTSLSVQGRVDDPIAHLTLNGEAVSLDAVGNFTAQAMLSVEGDNTLHFEAKNDAGKTGTLDAHTVRDTTPPVVTLTTPTEGWISNLHTVTVMGSVNDPTARLLVGGQSITADAQGHFEYQLTPTSESSQLLVALATDPAGNSGYATRGFTLDWTPPALTWVSPTPEEGSLVAKNSIPVAATISETATVDLNGHALIPIDRSNIQVGSTTAPYLVQTELATSEGQVLLTLSATDRAGNSSRIERKLDVGLTVPVIQLTQPTLDAKNTFTTRETSSTLVGVVTAPAFVGPLSLSANGKDLSLDATHAFTLPLTLAEGDNPVRLVAKNRFGQTTQLEVLVRRYTTSFGIEITWPLDGMATPDQSTDVMGRVLREGIQVTLNGTPVAVDSNLQFKTVLPLKVGDNLIQAVGVDSVGNQGTAQVTVTCAPPKNASFRWDTPVANTHSRIRTLSISGQADLPGITSITINGEPMQLSGFGQEGQFKGQVALGTKGRMTLSLEARTMAGEVLRERREVVFEPDLPLIRLLVPSAARPGETVALQVLPESGTTLLSADLRFNERLLAHITSPFAAQQAVIPTDAQIGSRIPVDAIGTDIEGETVTARAYISVYGSGALLQQVVDDRTALPLVGATVAIENGESGSTDAKGRAALSTALPTSWIRISKDGYSPVWRSAALKQAGVEASLDARPTLLETAQSASASPLIFGKGAMTLLTSAQGSVSATPLSAQGLPGLAPAGWSAVSAWWITGEFLTAPASAALKLDVSLPADAVYTWARWNETQHLWISLTPTANPASLPVSQAGGYALLIPDPAPTTPPTALAGLPIQPYSGTIWREGFTFTTGEGPHVMSTVEAIRGARMEALLRADFAGLDPVPSGAPVQAELLENYTLVDQRVIEPESFTQDLFAHRWELTVVEGAPVVQSAGNGLLLKHPVRMSRSFEPTELVQGRLVVTYFHDGVRVADTGSVLVGTEGGSVSNGGITMTLATGSVTGSALIRITPDSGDLSALWPELSASGLVKNAFQIDVVGTLLKGMGISLDALDASDTARPLVLQRRVVQGQRLTVTVGELRKSGSTWTLVVPEGGNPVLEGGAFAVLVPNAAWDWVSGTATMPASMAQPMIQKLGAKAGLRLLKKAGPASSVPKLSAMDGITPGDVTVADASVDGGYLLAVSGSTGSFAVPVLVPANATSLAIKGTRWDLGITGSITAPVPSANLALRLTVVPFAVTQILPSEADVVEPAAVLQVFTSTPMDPAGILSVRLFEDGTPQTEIILRRSLSQDGRTLLLTPDQPLPLSSSFILKVEHLLAQSGESVPSQYRRFQTAARTAIGDVDISRFRLSYPDAQYNITITIPEGAVPPWSIISVEATEMGACGQGVMRPTGALEFTMKAALGERIHVTVLLRDGRTSSGYIGRYVAEDGRTTLGVDGGRVEGPGGLAVIVPEGALSKVVELRAIPNTEQPQPAENALLPGEQMLGALELRSKEPIEFKKPPVIELPASAIPQGFVTLAQDAAATYGNGPVAIFQKVVTTLPDGTEDFSYVLMDTAQLSEDGQKLRSLGGLRLPDATMGTLVQSRIVSLTKRQESAVQPAMGKDRFTKTLAAKSISASLASYIVEYEPYSVGMFTLAWPVVTYQPQYTYQSGTVYRNWNGSGKCNGAASASCYGPLAYAEVHRYRGTTGLDEARKGRLSRGRLLTATDGGGKYLNVGGASAEAELGQTWISLFAVDPRTGETSIDLDSPTPQSLGLPWEHWDHSLAITSKGGNPFDPALTAPRIKAQMVDENGSARSMFAVGDRATLKLCTETGSQSVVRGKVTGSLEQDFGGLPTDIPVTFGQEGTWSASILGWTAKPVQGATSLSVIVTPAGQLGPSLPGKPTIISKDPAQGDEQVEPSALLKITFSEPVRSATASSFDLHVNGASVPFQVISNGQIVSDSSTLVQQVWLTPDQRLSLGSTVKVSVRGFISDQDGEAVDPAFWTFTVRGADEVGSLTGVGTYTKMVTFKGKIYAAEDVGAGYAHYQYAEGLRMYGIRIIDATDPSKPTAGPIFGQYRSWDPPSADFTYNWLFNGPFNKSMIMGLRVVTGVGIGGKSRDVLLVSTRPWVDQEIIMTGDPEYGIDQIVRFRQNALWVFDITGDADSTEVNMGNTIPKLLMSTSQGTMSDNWIKGIGGAGGMLGSIKLRGGMSIWDADKWKGSWDADVRVSSDWTIRNRTTSYSSSYYPDPQSLVASNGFYNASAFAKPTVMNSVFSEDLNGQPIAYAAMGYSAGLLVLIDGKVGQPDSLATFMGGGPSDMDRRIHDLSFAVNHEYTNLVETLKGTWQGPSGTEQGTLLLAGTTPGFTATTGKFWVLKPDLSDLTNPGAAQLAYANLPAKITKIIPDPARMLVGVEANGHAWIFDLKNLIGNGTGPLQLTPIYDFPVSGVWTLENGMLYDGQTVSDTRKLVIKNIDGMIVDLYEGIPIEISQSELIVGADAEYGKEDLETASTSNQMAGTSATTVKPMKAADSIPADQFLYVMSKIQLDNSGLPWLKHYYPDLGATGNEAFDRENKGKMQLSVILNTMDENIRNKVMWHPDTFGVQIRAYLINRKINVKEEFDVQHLKIDHNAPVPVGSGANFFSPISTNGDTSKINILSGLNAPKNPESESKQTFFYVPFAIQLPDSLRAAHESAMRKSEDDSWKVRVEVFVREKDPNGSGYKPKDTPDKALQFIVKYNSNTTLFDIAQGGTWYFDPVLSGGTPNKLNPNAVTPHLVDGTASENIANRLSLTPALYKKNPENIHLSVLDPVRHTVDGLQGSYNLEDAKLDVVQLQLDHAIKGLRRRKGLTDDPDLEDMQPDPSYDRDCIFEWNPEVLKEVGSLPEQVAQASDGLGAYAYKTLAMTNAVQWFEPEEAATSRNLNQVSTWADDPGKNGAELIDERNPGTPAVWKIMPALRQQLRSNTANWKFNLDAMVFHYMAAYPGVRYSPVQDVTKTYPVNALITRELVFGPGRSIKGDATLQGPDGVVVSLMAQRAKIDDCLKKISEIQDRTSPDVHTRFIELADLLEGQEIITIQSGTGEKVMFNPGIGILQLALSKAWLKLPNDNGKTSDPDCLTPDKLMIAEAPTTWDYVNDKNFNSNYYRAILDFLTKNNNWKTGRIDLFVNGVATPMESFKAYMGNLQFQLLEKEKGEIVHQPWVDRPTTERPEFPPLIGVYNISRKLRQGAYKGGLMHFFDFKELWTDKFSIFLDEGLAKVVPNYKGHFNPDTIRLIGALRAVVQALRATAFRTPFFEYRYDRDKFPSGQVYRAKTGPDGTKTYVPENISTSLVKTAAEIDQDQDIIPRPDDPNHPLTDDEKAQFKAKLKDEIARLNQLIEDYPIVLNAHSQGALKSAMALQRVGWVHSIRGNEESSPAFVAPSTYYVTYGGVADMRQYGKSGIAKGVDTGDNTKRFKAFVHNVNIWDPARLFGMTKPFGLSRTVNGEPSVPFAFPADSSLVMARDKFHRVFVHKRENENENTHQGFLWFCFDFSYHRFQTYACHVPTTRELPLLGTFPTFTPAEESKQMCQPPTR